MTTTVKHMQDRVDFRRYVLVFDNSGDTPVLVNYALAANKYRVPVATKYLKQKYGYRDSKYVFGLCYVDELDNVKKCCKQQGCV